MVEDFWKGWVCGSFLNGLMPKGKLGGAGHTGKKSEDAGRSSRPGERVRIASIDMACFVDIELDVPCVRVCMLI